MKPSDDHPDAKFERVLGDLEHLARELDGREFPGQAWSPAQSLPERRWAWTVAASMTGIAAALFILFYVLHALHPGVTPAPAGPRQIVQGPASQPLHHSHQSTMPRIVIVEDADSYSIIDLNNDIPLVSFASKDSPNLDEMMPILLDPSARPEF